MTARLCLAIVLCLSAAFLLACKDDSTPSATPTTAASATAQATRPPASATPNATFPPVEGTVDPLGFGGTDPQTIKPDPDPARGVAILRDVRIGAHPEQGGWDRIVFEFQSDLPGGRIEYVRSVAQCGSGMPVQLRGNAILQVKLDAAQAHNEAGQATIRANQLQGPGGAILEARQTCDFEADVTWAIGVTGMQRFKVTRLSNPTRLVIDIKW